MIYNYNKLWKLLIDKDVTKTQLHQIAGVSTNVIAKKGKNKTASMESLAKICVVLKCELSDIVEITTERGMRV